AAKVTLVAETDEAWPALVTGLVVAPLPDAELPDADVLGMLPEAESDTPVPDAEPCAPELVEKPLPEPATDAVGAEMPCDATVDAEFVPCDPAPTELVVTTTPDAADETLVADCELPCVAPEPDPLTVEAPFPEAPVAEAEFPCVAEAELPCE